MFGHKAGGQPRMRRVAGKSNLLRYPLRKIVEREGMREVLECGHVVRQREDLAGPTNAFRRRCRQCHEQKQVEKGSAGAQNHQNEGE